MATRSRALRERRKSVSFRLLASQGFRRPRASSKSRHQRMGARAVADAARKLRITQSMTVIRPGETQLSDRSQRRCCCDIFILHLQVSQTKPRVSTAYSLHPLFQHKPIININDNFARVTPTSLNYCDCSCVNLK